MGMHYVFCEAGTKFSSLIYMNVWFQGESVQKIMLVGSLNKLDMKSIFTIVYFMMLQLSRTS
jgi:hypothetical protein